MHKDPTLMNYQENPKKPPLVISMIDSTLNQLVNLLKTFGHPTKMDESVVF